jgi:hypothetical protein
MTNDTISFYCIAIFFIVACCYIIGCAVDMVTILSNLDTLGLSMLAIKPSFTIANLRDNRRYSEGDRQRNYSGLHTPIYRVLNYAERFILDKGISRDFDIHTNRGQQKWIYREGVLNIRLDRGYSEVSIGARTIFAVCEWTRTIHHINQFGMLIKGAKYTTDYDMTDVIAQVSEALEVIAQHYNAEKYKAIDERNARQEWYCYGADNLGVVNESWERATIQLWHKSDSKKSVEWTKYWGRETPSGAKEYKTTTGEHPSAYLVNIGGVEYWIPHSICSRTTALHGGREHRHDGATRFLGFQMHLQSIDLPLWWLEKTVGLDWSEFFKTIKRNRRWRR